MKRQKILKHYTFHIKQSNKFAYVKKKYYLCSAKVLKTNISWQKILFPSWQVCSRYFYRALGYRKARGEL